MNPPSVHLDNVSVTYRARRGAPPVRALDGVSLVVEGGSTLAVVGRSGAGKTTIARLLFGLTRPSEGTVSVLGTDVGTASRREIRKLRHRMHMVFQDPHQSIHPGFVIERAITEPLSIAGGHPKPARREAAVRALTDVGLTPPESFLARDPASLSGGQRQRVALARALVARPEVIVADEPASMLDASLRLSILELLEELRERHRAAMIYITHDLAMARHVADQIVVVDGGRVVEHGPTDAVLRNPAEPATRQLIAAVRSMTSRPGRRGE